MVQLEWFIYGALFGWLAQPIWEVIKKIVSEAKKAKEEW